MKLVSVKICLRKEIKYYDVQKGRKSNYKTNAAFLMSQIKHLQAALFRVIKHLFLTI